MLQFPVQSPDRMRCPPRELRAQLGKALWRLLRLPYAMAGAILLGQAARARAAYDMQFYGLGPRPPHFEAEGRWTPELRASL